MALSVKIESFEGPLDLLLHLIDVNKFNIFDIPIVEITNQYMEYIRQMQKQDLNIVSEFMVMAATLLDIKSKMLLPADPTDEEEEEDDEAAAPSPEELAGMDFEELEDVCDDHSLDVDPDDYEEEDIEKFRKAIAKELGITLPKAKKETKAKGKKGKK